MNWAVWISGKGTNLRQILADSEIRVSLVVSSRSQAPGLKFAEEAGVPTYVLEDKETWERVHQRALEAEVHSHFLAGFMKVIPGEFIRRWPEKIINLHPSMLPHYKGLHAMERAYQDNADMGVTIHKVVPEVDSGEVLCQRLVFENPQQHSFEHVKDEMQKIEHQMVPEEMKKWSKNVM